MTNDIWRTVRWPSRVQLRGPCLGAMLALTSVMCLAADTGEPEADVTAPLQVEGRLILTEEDVAELPQARLIDLMGADLPWSRAAATKTLAKQGAQSIPLFETALSSSDWRVVRAGLDGFLALLAESKEAEDEDLRDAAIKALPAIAEALKHEHYYVRMGALQILTRLGPDAASAASDVCQLFTDKDFMGVAPHAVRALAAIGTEHVEEDVLQRSLSDAIRSKDMAVRSAAVGVVAKLDPEEQRSFIPAMNVALRVPMKDGYTRYQLQGRIARMLQKLGEKQALPLSMGILMERGWGESHRVKTFVPILEDYGAEAISAVPLLEMIKSEPHYNEELTKIIDKAVASIKDAYANRKSDSVEEEEQASEGEGN